MKRFLLAAITACAGAFCVAWLTSVPASAAPSPTQAPGVLEDIPLAEADIPATDLPRTDYPVDDLPTVESELPVEETDGGKTTESAGFLLRNSLRGLALTVVPLPQFPAFDAVITRESGWNVFAINPSSGAYGLGQALPAFKMSTHGWDWPFNPLTQIRWTYDYMVQRYGGPDQAWEFWQRNHWY
ncbi:aggregation-promoting factor C-terminal-like domain-containing protein [Nocardia bovistercoris]|uniref:Lytic transglycosylase domain-containing protein n=1 Tax=Nocardia bovistercoris TaxID=2785916 RepID=A0A931I8R5_9NOCA|nr:lytic transglycosylase domain-containing protein [Nocardia bovistercoris]MBH0776939.1 lytic transglycosylase domain-containing protein [Nocardia bovistercoris]